MMKNLKSNFYKGLVVVDLDTLLEIESRATPGPWCTNIYAGKFCVQLNGKETSNFDYVLIDEMRNHIRQICLELKAAREYIEASKNIDWTWHDPEHCSYDDSSEGYDDDCECGALEIEKSLDKYLRVTNGQG